jgi:two-component system cell cycle response regulator
MTNISSFNVILIGFSELDATKLEKILGLTHSREKKYFARNESEARDFHIVLGNADNPASLARAKKLASQADETMLALVGSQPEIAAGIGFIARPIIGIRVIGVLDRLVTLNKDQIKQPVIAARQDAASFQQVQAGSGRTLRSVPETQYVPLFAPSPDLDFDLDLNFRVLIVDDSKLTQKTLELELRQASPAIEVVFASSGEEALERIHHDQTYDLIFLDVVMPGIDGYETCRSIRKDPRYKRNKPIIMLSARTSPTEQLNGYTAGCTNYLTKPIVHDEFQKMLHRVVAWLYERRPEVGGAISHP